MTMTVAELYALVGDTSLANYGKHSKGPASRYKYKGDFVYRVRPVEDYYYLIVGSGRYQDDWYVNAKADDEIEVIE